MSDTTIVSLKTTLLSVPWRGGPPAAGIVDPTPRQFVVVEIATKGGLSGMGYLHILGDGSATIDACLKEMVAPRILGRDATEVEGIWQTLWKSTYRVGRAGVAIFAMSAVDIALWDIVGKHAGLPLHRLWGNARASVPAYGSGCWRGLGRDGMIERARHFVGMGMKAIKMQVAHLRPWREDVRNVHAMREALGPDIEIMIDVNMGWTADTAIQAGHHIDEADPYWLEEPVVPEDYDGYQRVAAALKTRVVGGESHFTRYDLRPFFRTPSSPILQPDPMRGGLTELRKIAAIADTWGIQIAPHLFHELNVHVMASIPNADYLEYMDWNDDLWVQPAVPVDGVLKPGEAPGHGVAFKPEVLKDHRVGGNEVTTR
ncbi:MAG TPA: mandelate racemase/muconate lactonizing enzyme family protein [Hyphomicrobiaceae bacterium]|nr:mandelate racemase/muconate lactonizing enzyme family protein [Hyphomicrobiaceae bacterium]